MPAGSFSGEYVYLNLSFAGFRGALFFCGAAVQSGRRGILISKNGQFMTSFRSSPTKKAMISDISASARSNVQGLPGRRRSPRDSFAEAAGTVGPPFFRRTAGQKQRGRAVGGRMGRQFPRRVFREKRPNAARRRMGSGAAARAELYCMGKEHIWAVDWT